MVTRKMVSPLFRNPLLRLLFQLWWLPVLAAPVLWVPLASWVPWLLPHPAWVPIAYGAVLAGIAGTAGLHAAGVTLWEGLRHARRGHRFLCLHCLHFSEFRFACGACRSEVEPLIVHTRGAYVNDCPQCGAVLFSRDGETGVGVQAGCRHCGRVCEPEVYHERQVEVVGALRESDFAAFCAAIGAVPTRPLAGIPMGWHDSGTRLTVVLSVGELPTHAAMLPATHAIWAVERIWMDGSDVEPLKLGEAVDRFLGRTRLSAARRQDLVLCIGGEIPDGPASRLLTARFGTVVGHVAPAALVRKGAELMETRACSSRF